MLTSSCRKSCSLSLALCCLVGIAGCGAGKPEKVFQTWSSAVKAGNFPGVWECLSPTARGTVLQIMVMDADLLSGVSPAAKDAFGQVFTKHGLNPQDPSFAQSRLQVAKSSEYAADLNNVFRQFQNDLGKLEGSRYQKLNAIWNASAQANLGPSQNQGTRATAAVQGAIPHTTNNASVQAVFEKVNGKWLFAELEESAAAGAAGMAGGPAARGPGGPGMPDANGRPGMDPASRPGMDPMSRPGMADAKNGPPGQQVAMGGPADPKGMPANSDPALNLRPGMDPNRPGAADPKGMPANSDPALNLRPGMDPNRPGAADDKGTPANSDPARRPGMDPNRPGLGDDRAMARDGGGDNKSAADRGNSKAGPNDRPMAAGDRPGLGPADNPRGNPDDPATRPGLAPGRDGATGRDGAAGGRDGAGGGQKPPAGSWQYAVLTFAEKIAAGEDSGYEKLINSRARGVLAEIRNGELDPDKLEEMKANFAEAQPMPESFKNTGSSIEVKLKGKLGHIITVTVAKEGKEFRIRDLKITEPADK